MRYNQGMQGDLTEKRDITSEDIKDSLIEIPERAWEIAEWPIISIVSRQNFSAFASEEKHDNERELRKSQSFWKQALFPTHILTPENVSELLKNPDDVFLFMIHSFKDSKGQDIILKAITTTPEEFVNDPFNSVNYTHHGQPCEQRGGGSYPTVNFWNFYDGLQPEVQDYYSIPDTNWRKAFIKKNILKTPS